MYGVGAASKQVQQEYDRLLDKVGPELVILLDAPPGGDRSLRAASGWPKAIGRMRRGEVIAEGGYDGEYGVIRIFAPGAGGDALPQFGLFTGEEGPAALHKLGGARREPSGRLWDGLEIRLRESFRHCRAARGGCAISF